MMDLTGYSPYEGQKIKILSVRQYPGGWAVAGNPIKWMYQYVNENILRAHQNDDWIFGIIHEIGHDFDLDVWNFNAEHSANFKLYYAISSLNGKIYDNGTFYIGSQLKQFYLNLYTARNRQYETTGSLWGFNDCITYRFVDLAETLGWESVKATFRDLAAMDPDQIPDNPASKFNLFLDTWSDNVGVSVRSYIPANDLERFLLFLNQS